jgi:hypothetical protein
MRFDLKQLVRVVTACVLATIFAVPQSLMAQATAHVVGPSDLQKELLNATQTRQQNLETVRQFLSTARAKQAMKTAHINPEQVTTAVSTLTDTELAQLAARAQKAQADFAAGDFSDRDLILIILAIAALILIIVAVR